MSKFKTLAVAAGLLLIPGLALLAGGPSPAAATATPGHKWCDPLRVYIPQRGFSPLHASASQLRLNGFPPRPPASDSKALAAWIDVVTHARHFSAPDPVCSTSTRSTVYSGNWAGHVVPKSDYGGYTFVQVQSEWKQPSVPGNSNYTDYNTAPDASFWDGIGVSDLLQAGCDSIATATPTYKCWTEDYPQYLTWEGPAVSPGNLMYVYVSYQGGNYTYYYLENVTTGHAVSFDNYTPYVGSNAANFIIERPNGKYLPDFGKVAVSDNYFWQSNNTKHELTTTNNRVDMTSNCLSSGTLLSEPTSVSSGAFDQQWYHSQPYSNSC